MTDKINTPHQQYETLPVESFLRLFYCIFSSSNLLLNCNMQPSSEIQPAFDKELEDAIELERSLPDIGVRQGVVDLLGYNVDEDDVQYCIGVLSGNLIAQDNLGLG